ncbi:transmembrane protein 26 [Bactrocera neohumeralis]|uniref:Transmembrane protein 26 n=1 Tax=Bactrocera dorsalis TaxID=27457 RepID=A0A6I9VL48_BACDO|nr:transmembrane protein 26 [Bactrocera dorsalis]XP_039947534.1 transmembrane protein 26 [Bactrocera tryoni]XP_050330153.1 transmembrane protein 26 [Bactrocera neohumeralis]
MAKIISTFKAILTRIFFGAHSILAIWQVTVNTKNYIYWSLCGPLVLLLLEGIFTLMIKKTQEWRWFCPSVFLYLSSIVPAIWLLELDQVARKLNNNHSNNNSSNENILQEVAEIADLDLPVFKIDPDTWITLIEQFLMLILIVGRWMLPKGDLTRDQLSQLLLVYIGTAADIMEFFESYKDVNIIKIDLLVFLTLGIWSWSLMQFTIVLSATRARRPRGGGIHHDDGTTDCCDGCCCGIDVWAIVLNVILQDAPFLTLRMLIIFQYKILNYMSVFFTCKNTLVIVLQLYRLYVVNAEFWKNRREQKSGGDKSQHYKSRRRAQDPDANSIYMISTERGTDVKRKIQKARDYAEDEFVTRKKNKKDKSKKHKRKDTGYSTASSQNLYSTKMVDERSARQKDKRSDKKSKKRDRSNSSVESDIVEAKKSKRGDAGGGKRSEKKDKKKKSKKVEPVMEETTSSSSSSTTTSSSSDSSNSTLPSYEVISERKLKSNKRKRSSSESTSTDSSDTTTSSSSSSSSSS